MNYKDGLVSIVLPIYNAENFLWDCLESLLSQTYKDIEIVAIDDSSTDGSYAILREFKKLDKRIKALRNKKRYGLRVTLNRCLKQAKGQHIAFMGARDKCHASRIQKQVSYLAAEPKIAAVGTQCNVIDKKNKKVEQSKFPIDNESMYKAFVNGKSLQYESMLVDRLRVPKDLLVFSQSSYPFVFSDVFLRLFKYAQCANLPQYLYSYRKFQKTRKKTFSLLLGHITFLVKKITTAEYRPSLGSFFTPLGNQI